LLSAKALTDIETQVPPGGFLITDSLFTEAETIAFDPPPGEPGTILSLDLIQDYQAYYIKAEDLRKLGALVLDASLPKGFSSLPSSLVAVPFGTPTVGNNGEITWGLSADRLMAEDIDEMSIITKVLGKTPDTAKKFLSGIKLADSAEISLSPTWWLLMPSIPMRISIETVQ
jgi:hypothetical protein